MECVCPLRVDVTDRQSLDDAAAELIGRWGKVHVLVNNAGVIAGKTVTQSTCEDFQWIFRVNVEGVFNGTQVFLPYIRAHGEGGHIISTSSMLGLFASVPEGLYVSSKFAVVGMMETLRAELGDANIGVSVLCPGYVASKLSLASRNRPHGGNQPTTADNARLARLIEEHADILMDPIAVGHLVLKGMQENRLYILTHPEWAGVMETRHACLLAANPEDQGVSEARREIVRASSSVQLYEQELKSREAS